MSRPGLIIGNPTGVRVDRFQQALLASGHPEAQVVGYADWINGSREQCTERLATADWVRLDSPERCETSLEAIYRLAQPCVEPEVLKQDSSAERSPQFTTVPAQAKVARGLRQFALSFPWFVDQQRPLRFLNHPRQIALSCHKPLTVARLSQANTPTPTTVSDRIDPESGYESLIAAMETARRTRVFIKPVQGSSGVGVVAYQRSASRELAVTTVALQATPQGPVLYNTRKIQRYSSPTNIRLLLNALATTGVYAEEWFPKAGVNGRVGDLRVVTVAGRVSHTVLRLSRHPITNLHLRNARADPELLRAKMRPSDWEAVIDTCERVARVFNHMLYLGIDVAIHADGRRHAVIEVNAFGDLLHGVETAGRDTYAVEVDALDAWLREPKSGGALWAAP